MSRKNSRVTRIPVMLCPNCGARLNALGTTDQTAGETAGPGDLSLCVQCSQPLFVQEDFTLRLPTEEECYEISQDPEVRRLVAAIIAAQQMKKARLN